MQSQDRDAVEDYSNLNWRSQTKFQYVHDNVALLPMPGQMSDRLVCEILQHLMKTFINETLDPIPELKRRRIQEFLKHISYWAALEVREDSPGIFWSYKSRDAQHCSYEL